MTANTGLGTQAKVQEQMTPFFDGLQTRTAEVQTRCRRQLRALAEGAATSSPAALMSFDDHDR
ncbi:MAG: hypothetical protein M3Q65_23200 [Chloroflexota bacterium]|nr:hypothetical protein [Chloroflexota bacterium]